MEIAHITFLAIAISAIAFLYSSVGHAGASGYIAVMTLFGLGAATVRPTALVLNILVACIGTYQFWRAGHFSWKLFWPFALLAVPAAFLGGYLHVPAQFFKTLVGVVLILSALRLFFRHNASDPVSLPPRIVALGAGAGIGLLSGLTGTGGGIFLTPLLLFCRWAHTRQAAAVSALFILLNSTAALLGHAASGQQVPSFAWVLAGAAVVGGTLGSYFGSRRFHPRSIQILLAAVLLIAGAKLLFA